VLPAHKPFLVVHFDGLFYLDHCFPFGAASASSNAGQIFNAIMDIWRAEMGQDGDGMKYEDDSCIIRIPNASGPFVSGEYHYRFDRTSIVAPIVPVRTPWNLVKTGYEFLTQVIYLGFLWDFQLRRVSLPEIKRLKFLARVRNAVQIMDSSGFFSLTDLQELHGSLCHLCFVIMDGASRIAVFSNAMSGFKGNNFIKRKLSNTAYKALVWWHGKLSDASIYRQLRPLGVLRDFGIYVDASTSWGVAVVIGKRWFAWQLAPDWKRPGTDICWLESVAIELLFMFLQQMNFRDIHVLVRSDNKGAIGAHKKGRSPNFGINLCARRTFVITASLAITPNIVYVPSADNLADAPSRGLDCDHLRPADRLTCKFDLPQELADVFLHQN
jgi:hypothetical protein